MLRELVLQRLNGYYFLQSVEDDGDEQGYVIVLREVNNLTRRLAQKIANGLDKDEAKSIPESTVLNFGNELFAMPIGELKSPVVEHVLQIFSNLFGRIGVDDPPKAYLDSISTRRPQKE